MVKLTSYCFLLYMLTGSYLYAQVKTNVVVILADDLGYGDLGCYGQKLIKTPNLDRMAARGIRFTQFYAGSTVCAPSRAALMTGKHTGHTAIRGNREVQPEGQFPLPDSSFTMAELFKKAGYITGVFGKWALGFPGSEGAPNRQGFDEFFGYNCQRQAHNYFPDHLWNNQMRIELSNTFSNQHQYAPDLIQKQALSFIEKNKEKPFFIYLPYTLPHAGLQLPAGDTMLAFYKNLFRQQPVPIKGEWNGVGYQPHAYPLAAYAAMVSRLDAYVGEVMAKLKELGIEKNTLVVFSSDNGPHREGGHQPEFFQSNGGFRGIKRDLFEGGIREPMIVCWPFMVKTGRSSDHVGASWDLLPTFAALTGQQLPLYTDGLSILPLLTSKGSQKKHPYLYWEFHENGGSQAVRMGKWKAIRLNIKNPGAATVLLFNLDDDPKESKDVGTQHAKVLRMMTRIMEKEHTPDRSFPLFVENKFK